MIVFAHLLNDYSGSPRVLLSTIAALKSDTHFLKLYIGSDGNGCLSECHIPIKRYWYRRTNQRVFTLFTYLISQVLLFFAMLRDRDIDRKAVIYVNTLLPIGAALFGWVTGRKVIFHVHEISITPAPLKWLLIRVARLTSQLNIYVSDAHVSALPIAGVNSRRIYNALNPEFSKRALNCFYSARRNGVFSILMITYLRDYKGVPELIALCQRLHMRSDVRFVLLVNDDHEGIERYFRERQIPSNLTIYPRAEDTTPFYSNASLLLNLSRSDECVETFGLTILEAMAFGVPVIVPPVGGPAELVIDGLQGFWVDSRNLENLERAVLELVDNERLCEVMSEACRLRALEFSGEIFATRIRQSIAEVAG